MEHLVSFLIGAGLGALAVSPLAMNWVERWKTREKAAARLSASARAETQQARERGAAVEQQAMALQNEREKFEKRVITYGELQAENRLLKRDLQNVDVMTHRLEIEGEVRQRHLETVATRSDALAKRFLAETVKAVVAAVGPSNYTACKQRLADAISRCREIGYVIPTEAETALLADLRIEFEKAVRAAFEREEQARIKAQIREEEQLKREVDRELRQLERERAAVQSALEVALTKAKGEHTAEVAELRRRLAEADEKKRSISMAQLTKAGHVHVISNLGTLGPDIYKIGMTRRLKPQERIDELGSASVPFPFDVHMMISTTNAPGLENALHRALHNMRVNKANPRKEFFRVTLDQICRIVEAEHGKVDYRADPVALEYNQSRSMSDEDAAFVEQVYSDVEDEQVV